MNFQRGTRHEEPEINLIPLIDVVLVIIIFLMLTTSFSKVAGLEINLPTAQGESAAAPPEEIVVVVSAAGEVLINRQAVRGRDISAIAAALERAIPPGGEQPVVVINADAKAAHQHVIDVMQAAQRTGLGHITFAVQAPNP
jgi:biopolymer transport protein ExbD